VLVSPRAFEKLIQLRILAVKGKVIANKYRISSQLGLGGMGTVYRAQHLVLERDSAIKLLHPQLNSDSTFVERFMREARAMARLDHENIIRIYDVFQDDNVHLIAMELFDGVSLKTLIETGKQIPVAQSVSIILQCARGLAYAHAQGIVHRDIKPSNIMINSQGHIKITDFGIAAAVDDSATLTTTGQLVGTPRYMSPEQARSEPVDRRSDIYALGMVAYELLTGSTPFEGESGVSIIGKLAYDNSELKLQFPARVNEELQAIVRKMLAKSADDRFTHATHLMQALKSVLESLQVDDSTMVLPTNADSGRNLQLEPRYKDKVFDDPQKTKLIKNPPTKINSGTYSQSVKKTWIKSKPGKLAVAVSIVFGIGIGVLMVMVNPELDFNLRSNQTGLSAKHETEILLDKLLDVEKQTQQQHVKAKEWQGDSLAADTFSRGFDKELIASQSIVAIRNYINKNENEAALRNINAATLLMTGALDLYREAEKVGKQKSKEEITSELDELKQKTWTLNSSVGADNLSQAIQSNYDQAKSKVQEADIAYAKLTNNWNLFSFQEAQEQRDAIRNLYENAASLLENMKSYAQQEDVLNNIYAIRSRVRDLRNAISSAEDKAFQHHADKFAGVEFNKARAMNGKLGSMLVEADQILKQKKYNNAHQQFEKSIQLAEQTLVLFQNASEKALVGKEQTNANRLSELKKIETEKGSREKELAVIQSEQSELADKKAYQTINTQAFNNQTSKTGQANRGQLVASNIRSKPSQKDMVDVEKMLSSFKQAIEQRNLQQLREVADLSDNHLKIMTEVFSRFNEVHLSVTSYSLSRTGATASFQFDKLVTAKGDDVLPSSNWRNGELELIFGENGWEKIRWY